MVVVLNGREGGEGSAVEGEEGTEGRCLNLLPLPPLLNPPHCCSPASRSSDACCPLLHLGLGLGLWLGVGQGLGLLPQAQWH